MQYDGVRHPQIPQPLGWDDHSRLVVQVHHKKKHHLELCSWPREFGDFSSKENISKSLLFTALWVLVTLLTNWWFSSAKVPSQLKPLTAPDKELSVQECVLVPFNHAWFKRSHHLAPSFGDSLVMVCEHQAGPTRPGICGHQPSVNNHMAAGTLFHRVASEG